MCLNVKLRKNGDNIKFKYIYGNKMIKLCIKLIIYQVEIKNISFEYIFVVVERLRI